MSSDFSVPPPIPKNLFFSQKMTCLPPPPPTLTTLALRTACFLFLMALDLLRPTNRKLDGGFISGRSTLYGSTISISLHYGGWNNFSGIFQIEAHFFFRCLSITFMIIRHIHTRTQTTMPQDLSNIRRREIKNECKSTMW